MKGETLLCLKTGPDLEVKATSAAGLMLRGFAGILGLSALLTGGGIGDFGRGGAAVLLAMDKDSGSTTFEFSTLREAPGEGCLDEDLLL